MHGRGRMPPKTEPQFRGTAKASNTSKQRTSVKELPRNNTLKTGLKSSSLNVDENITVVSYDKIQNGKNDLATGKNALEALTGMDVDSDEESSGSGSFTLVNGKRTKKNKLKNGKKSHTGKTSGKD